jgi:hypothetical protein
MQKQVGSRMPCFAYYYVVQVRLMSIFYYIGGMLFFLALTLLLETIEEEKTSSLQLFNCWIICINPPWYANSKR